MKQTSRNYAYDVLRVLAILLVLFCHKYSYSAPELLDTIDLPYILALCLSILYKCGPPLFLMISGALLLGKTESFKTIFFHRILRFLILMVLCTLVVCLIHLHNRFEFRVELIFFGGLNWYLYAYLAFLCMLPFLRLIAQHADGSQRVLYLILAAVFYSVSGIFLYAGLDARLLDNMPLFNTVYASNCWHLIFPLAGYFIAEVIKEGDAAKVRKLTLWTSVVAVLNLVQGEVLFSLDRFVKEGVNLEMMRQHAGFGPTCLIFLLILRFTNSSRIEAHPKGAWVLRELSGATLGVFLIETHTNFSGLLSLQIVKWSFLADLPYTRAILAVAIEFVVYSLTVMLLRRIPGIKKLL